MFVAGLERIGFAAQHHVDGSADRVLGARHQRPGAATEPRRGHGRTDDRGEQLAAVLGTGQTQVVAKRPDVSMNGLVREAIDRALADSGSDLRRHRRGGGRQGARLLRGRDDAGAVHGRRRRRDGQAADPRAHGGLGRRVDRVVAASLVQSGKYRRVLAMAWEKQSESNAMWALSIIPCRSSSRSARARRVLRPARAGLHPPLRRARAHRRHGRGQGPAQRRRNPLAHLQQPDITLEKVMASPMLWDPIRYDETCPSSDGACAVVIGNEDTPRRRSDDGHPVAWIHATALRTEPTTFSGRDQVNPQAGRDAAAALWKAGGHHQPHRRDRRRRDLRAVLVVRADVVGEPRVCGAEGEGWKLTEAGETEIGGRLPVNPSGGVLSSNPIGASGLIRFAEAAHPGDGQGRRSSGPGRAQGARPRLRRRLAVLLHVGGGEHR